MICPNQNNLCERGICQADGCVILAIEKRVSNKKINSYFKTNIMKSGIELIAAERQEQIEKHGRTIYSDVSANGNWELSSAAIALLTRNSNFFPSTWDTEICAAMISKPDKERFIIAGALIAAEIDRMQFPVFKEAEQKTNTNDMSLNNEPSAP